MKRCLIVSFCSQKQQLVLPLQLRLSKLSLVSMTPLYRNNINILILRGTLILQIGTDVGKIPIFIICEYMDLTENSPFLVKIHVILSDCSDKCTCMILSTKCNHASQRGPTKARLNCILSGVDCSIVDT